jgi:CDP-diglyceride synthetase
MPEDMSFNKHVDVAPPPIPKKSSKGLIVGILVTILALAAAGYGYHAGVFKPEKGAGEVVVKGDC